jgi:hypothetical protein
LIAQKGSGKGSVAALLGADVWTLQRALNG